MPDEPLTALTKLEAGLQKLVPVPSQLNRDNLFHAAGRGVGERRLKRWQAASFVLALASVGLAAGLLFRPVRVEERVVTVVVPASAPVTVEPAAAPASAPRHTEESVASFGRDTGMVSSNVTYREMLWRGLRFGPEVLTTATAHQASANLPNDRSVEQDLNLPPDTLHQWSKER